MTLIALLLLSAAGPDDAVRESVDLVEINHFFDEKGDQVYVQQIFLDWNQHYARYDIVAWRLIKHSSQWPQRVWGSKFPYVITWHDGGVLREIRFKALSETWTQSDPELKAREYLPKEHRRELMKPELLTPARVGAE